MFNVGLFYRNKIKIAVSSFFAILHYGLGMKVFYQPDIYMSMCDPLDFANDYINPGGRIVAALIYWVVRRICSAYKSFFYVSLILSLFVLVIAITCFAQMAENALLRVERIRKTVKLEVFTSVVSCLTIANLFSLEYFLYPNSTLGVVLDILLCILASKVFMRIVDDGISARNVGICTIILVVAVFIYEPPLAVFVIISTLFTVVNIDKLKSAIYMQLLCAGCYGTAMTIKLLFTKYVIGSYRTQFDSLSLSSSAISYAPKGELPMVFILDRITVGMWTYAVACMFVFFMIIYEAIKKNKVFILFKTIYLSIVTIGMGILPFVFRLSNDYRPRIYYPLGMMFGVLVLFGTATGLFAGMRSSLKMVGCYLGVTLCIFQWLTFVEIYRNQYITNYDDRMVSEEIGECIREYEVNNQQTISYVSFYSDAVRTKYICNDGTCITQRAYDAEWSKLATLNFYLDRSFKKGNVDENIAEYFIEKNWDCFSTDQLIFLGDTVHVCTY